MRTTRKSRWVRPFSLLTALAALVGCAEAPPTAVKPPGPVSAATLRAALTESVALSVNENGQFVFESPQGGDRPEISEGRARALALALWRTREATYRRILARDRGGVALASNLTVCPRVFYVESGYEPFPSDLPTEIRRAFGPQWMVGLCRGSEQQVAIAVSVEATDLQITEGGVLAEINGGDFWATGVPIGTTVPALPEAGAIAVAAPRYRVAALPVLRRRANSAAASLAEWVYPIEAVGPVRGLVTGARRSIGLVRYGPYTGFGDARPIDENPEYASFPRDEVMQAQLSESNRRSWTLRRRADVPYRGEPVVREAQ